MEMSFFRSLVRRRRFTMWKWRALCSSMLTLLSSEARIPWRDGESYRSGARECRCICYWATHRVQFSPGVVAGRKHSKGASAFQFLPHSCLLRIPLCGRGVHQPQCSIHMVNGSHWRGGRGSRHAHQIIVFCWFSVNDELTPCTCRASSHAFQLHVARTAFVKNQTVKKGKKQKINMDEMTRKVNEHLLWE